MTIRLLGAGVLVCALGVSVSLGSEQTAAGKPAPDGLLRAEVSLDAHTLGVSVRPSLAASDPAHRALLSEGSAGRVQIGQLQTNAALRLGSLSFAKNDLRGARYDLWLEGTREAWQLEIVEEASKDGGAPAAVGKVALALRPSAGSSPALVPALMPAGRDAARLVLRWGDVEAAADVQFTEQRRSLTGGGGGGGGQPSAPVNRRHDEDTSALSRLIMLTQRNESALVLPAGPRISVTFARTLAPGQDSGSRSTAAVRSTAGLGVEGPDFARLLSTPDGAVVQLTQAAIPRLSAGVPLRFGRTLIRPGNQAPGIAGAYGLWLKRAGRGWRLVFSHEPDAWGSQYDRRHDASEIELTHAQGPESQTPFAVALVPTAPTRGRLIITWGPHEWSAEYTIAG